LLNCIPERHRKIVTHCPSITAQWCFARNFLKGHLENRIALVLLLPRGQVSRKSAQNGRRKLVEKKRNWCFTEIIEGGAREIDILCANNGSVGNIV